MNISILLPFKENFSRSKAGAVSLFVKDTTKASSFKKKITIFGSTDKKDFLSHNYVNLKAKKQFFKSSNTEYVKTFLNHKFLKKTNILEVHNRPNYIKQIKKYYKEKIFIYFHNDPLSMSGSKSISEREYLISNVDKIIFNSNWSKKRFLVGLDSNNFTQKTAVCYQSTNKVKIDFQKKKKIISFIGKLNRAKGFDIFGKAIVKILNEYNDWKGYIIGDEPREKITFYHKNLINLGFKNNDFILNFLKKTSISVVSSRWDEPFGRASLEAASRGSAVIISDKGGLPETTSTPIILKSLNENVLYLQIKKLIENKKLLSKYQKSNYRNFYLDHKFVTSIIDKLRNEFIFKRLNLNLKKNLKIIHITNFNYRFNGRLQYNTGRRINNGLVRLGHNVLTISDRDIISQNKSLTDFSGKSKLQEKIIASYYNFKPDVLILGHADSVSYDTINFFKSKNIRLSQWFLDPVSKFGPDYLANKERVLHKDKLLDASFLTTDPSALDFNIKNSHFIPNPCDESFETLENYNKNCKYDLFFAMSHGVHRGELKKGKHDRREVFINKLINKNKNINFDTYGMNHIQPVWGDEFLNKISNCSMGLNLSRGKPIKYYSSDRIAQLMGNGLLTFIDEKTKFGDFFSKNEIIFYKNIDDLSYKLNKYKKDKNERKRIAKKGKEFYFKYFNSTTLADFILKKTLDINTKKRFIWEK